MTQATVRTSTESLQMGPPLVSRALGRLRQFGRGLRAEVSEAERRRAAELLPHAAFDLFLLMPVDAQRHSLDVLATLESEVQSAGAVTPDLAAAALLHDVGKLAAWQAGHPITLWLRGPLVLLDAFAPSLLKRLADPNPAHGWRYALHVHGEHPAIGAEWAAEAGCSPQTCWLIAWHQSTEAQGSAHALHELARLQRADHLN